MLDLWFRQPRVYINHALEAGATNFTWHLASALSKRIDVLSWFRNAVVGYGECRMMIVDYSGASEYTQYTRYEEPIAVYPTWSADEEFSELVYLVENPVSENPEFTDNQAIARDMRPVKGQKHRVVLHQLGPATREREGLLLRIRDLQLLHPECEIFISQQIMFSILFGFGFQAGDCMPGNVIETGSIVQGINLPTGKYLKPPNIWDLRYSDWFELLGWKQRDIVDRHQMTRFNIESLMWAARNYDKAVPFVLESTRGAGTTGGRRTLFRPHEFKHVSDKDFILPSARRHLMRNLGLDEELDKLACDTCMLHNACTLYREGAVCAVKGSEGVELSKHFGTRNAQAIITGLDHLLKKQVQRLEDAQAAEEVSGEPDPDLTKQYNSVFANASKLAKLIDPSLAGGAKVQVNVGVAGNAAIAVASADPKQMVASVVAELEASGIPRAEITPEMIKGVLTGMASRGEKRAVQAVAAASPTQLAAPVIPGELA
jgi:hypothetical protein